MSCIGNCNQGRNCVCARVPVKLSGPIKAAIAIVIMVLVAEFAMLLHMIYPQAGRWAATILAALFGLTAVGCLLWWLAEGVIRGIDFMTRSEDSSGG